MSVKSNTAKKIHLTSRAKSPKGAQAPATNLKATLQAAIEQVAAKAPGGPGLDGQSNLPEQSIGELVKPIHPPARGKTKAETKPAPKAKKATPAPKANKPEPKPKAAKAKPEAKKPAPAADTTAQTLLALLTRPEGATPREMMDATGLSHEALKRFNTNVIRRQLGCTFTFQKNPGVDPDDRALTANLFFISK